MKRSLKEKLQGIQGNAMQAWQLSDWKHEDLKHHLLRTLVTLGHQIDAEMFDYHIMVILKHIKAGISWEAKKQENQREE